MADPPSGPRPGTPSTGARRRIPAEGVLEVFVADEQSVHAIDVQRWGDLARNVLLAEGIRGDAELSLLFVSHDTMADLNARFMDGEGPTDVLSFPIEEDLMELGRWPDLATTGPDRSPPDPSDAPLLLGDVVISPEVAAANAPGHAGSFDDEIALLVVHGVLHILGLDHGDPDEAREMRAKEQDLLARFHGPVAAGTEVPPEQ
ncbi:MAG TPA: rRNA maturation RNase YbeY [Acidimicrobiales bacterium]|nr:rRNA maturation RNase YbeY [Acidimicrobiales bacterium]